MDELGRRPSGQGIVRLTCSLRPNKDLQPSAAGEMLGAAAPEIWRYADSGDFVRGC